MEETKIYQGYELTGVAVPGQGYVVEIEPVSGGKWLVTEVFASLSEDMVKAQAIVDWLVL